MEGDNANINNTAQSVTGDSNVVAGGQTDQSNSSDDSISNNQNNNTQDAPQSDPNLAPDDALKQAKAELIDGMTAEDILKADVLELMGFSKDLPEDKRQSYLRRIQESIENRVAARIYDALDDEGRKKYDQILDNGTPEEGYEYLISRDIDAAKWMAEETLIMKMELYEDGRMVKAKAAMLARQDSNQDNNQVGESNG